MKQVELKGIRKVYGATVALEDIDLEISSGEYIVVLGPSEAARRHYSLSWAGLRNPAPVDC